MRSTRRARRADRSTADAAVRAQRHAGTPARGHSDTPTTFASLVAASPALYLFRTGAYLTTADEVSQLASTPTWFVQSKDDATVPYDKASVWAHDLLPGSQLTLYDTVTWDGQTYPGHWSWIYLAHDDPRTAQGVPVWTWMSQQHRSTPQHGGR